MVAPLVPGQFTVCYVVARRSSKTEDCSLKTTSLLRLAAAHGVLATAVFAAPAFAQDTAPVCIDVDANGVCDVPDADDSSSGPILVEHEGAALIGWETRFYEI